MSISSFSTHTWSIRVSACGRCLPLSVSHHGGHFHVLEQEADDKEFPQPRTRERPEADEEPRRSD